MAHSRPHGAGQSLPSGPKETTGLIIDLPFPVSTNRVWRYRGLTWTGRPKRKLVILSKEYTDWKQEADALFLMQKSRLMPLPCFHSFMVYITFSIKLRKSNQDGDNLIKCVLDWLQRVDLIENDCFCDGGSWLWGEAPEGCRVELFGP